MYMYAPAAFSDLSCLFSPPAGNRASGGGEDKSATALEFEPGEESHCVREIQVIITLRRGAKPNRDNYRYHYQGPDLATLELWSNLNPWGTGRPR